MKTVCFEVPRLKEEVVDNLLDILTDAMPEQENITHFHADKCRNRDNTTLYFICYVDKN